MSTIVAPAVVGTHEDEPVFVLVAGSSSNCSYQLSHLYVGRFDAEGLSVHNLWDDDRDPDIWLAASRKFQS